MLSNPASRNLGICEVPIMVVERWRLSREAAAQIDRISGSQKVRTKIYRDSTYGGSVSGLFPDRE